MSILLQKYGHHKSLTNICAAASVDLARVIAHPSINECFHMKAGAAFVNRRSTGGDINTGSVRARLAYITRVRFVDFQRPRHLRSRPNPRCPYDRGRDV